MQLKIIFAFLLFAIIGYCAGDFHIPGLPKPKPVIIPNWNPNARIKPWQAIGVRRPRSVADLSQEEMFDSVERFKRSPKSVESFDNLALDSRSMERVKRSPKSVESFDSVEQW
ncbi:unnamed protein product [Pieris brassicae]|uniref:Uncharacterized protein n=1 Tax=Pieris brassicae TaxID=7116 RepID=A0A9P0XJI3_PIEBR|nr:unnamed protein product [Pieris brassicae]